MSVRAGLLLAALALAACGDDEPLPQGSRSPLVGFRCAKTMDEVRP